MDENNLPSYPPALDFATVNDWTHSTGRHLEELQGACLGMAAEIDRLRDEIADARRQLQAGWIEVCQTSADLLQKDLAEKLAASQAREKVLREMFLLAVEFGAIPAFSLEELRKQFFTIPVDDTALRQAVIRAQEEMRERCAVACDEKAAEWAECEHSARWQRECASAIRALEVKP